MNKDFLDDRFESKRVRKYTSSDEIYSSSSKLNKNLVDLNDDCLLEIFKLLNFSDLISLSGVNLRFDAPIASCLRQTHEVCTLNFRTFASMEKFFGKFGSHITRIDICPISIFRDPEFKRFQLILKYVKENTLLSLAIRLDNSVEEMITSFGIKLNRLQKLKIGSLRPIEHKMNLLKHCELLTSIEFRYVSFESPTLRIGKYEHLRTLSFGNCHFDFSPTEILNFIEQFGLKLETFKMNECFAMRHTPNRCFCIYRQYFIMALANTASDLKSMMIQNSRSHFCKEHLER